MQKRLTFVYALLGFERDEIVLIEVAWIGARVLDVVVSGQHIPAGVHEAKTRIASRTMKTRASCFAQSLFESPPAESEGGRSGSSGVALADARASRWV
jgi:hypothetical protein